MNIMSIVGARPNFIKIAAIDAAMAAVNETHVIVHTGQHYDSAMSDVFFDELQIPKPCVNLQVASGHPAAQTSEIMRELAPVIQRHDPDCVLVVGDVTSTVAATITAKQLGYPVAHVEAGLRSRDRSMPEEVNRLIVDSVSDWLFAPEYMAEQQLRE